MGQSSNLTTFLSYVTGNVVVGEVEPWEMFQVDDLWLELAQDEPETQKNGLIFIFDMKNLSLKYLTYFTPHNCKVGSSKAEVKTISVDFLSVKNQNMRAINNQSPNYELQTGTKRKAYHLLPVGLFKYFHTWIFHGFPLDVQGSQHFDDESCIMPCKC